MSTRIEHLVPIVALLAGGIGAVPASGQTTVDLTSGTRGVTVSTSTIYQSYEEDGGKAIDQLSVPFSLDVPLSRNWRLTLWGHQMSTSGDAVEDLSGLADAQLFLSYARRIGTSSLVISTGVNAPTGKQKLTSEEFETQVLVSQSAFDYRVPSLGQGLGLSPSISWAFQVSRGLVLGLGTAYQYHAAFKPVDYLEEDYTPGDEILLTAGLDIRLGRTSAFSADLTHALYAADRLGDEEVYQSGDKSTATGMIRGYRGLSEWRLLGLYRSRSKSDELAGTALVTEEERTLPNELMLQASYRARMSRNVQTEVLVQARFFDETEVYPKRDVFDIGVIPTFRLSQGVALTSRFVYTTGSITGFEAGGGLILAL